MKRVVVAITGASGALYAVRFLRAALESGLRVELIVSDYGRRLLIEECKLNLKTTAVEDWLESNYGPLERRGEIHLHREQDLGASIASGSQRWDGMVVLPTLEQLADFIVARVLSLLDVPHDLFQAWKAEER